MPIQAAVALLHFGNGNLGGAKKVYLSSRKYLEPFQPRFEGLDVAKFLNDLQHCFQQLIDNTEQSPTGVELLDERVPKIILPDAADFPACWPVLRKHFGDVRPAATMISAGLIDPNMKIEIEVTAKLPAES